MIKAEVATHNIVTFSAFCVGKDTGGHCYFDYKSVIFSSGDIFLINLLILIPLCVGELSIIYILYYICSIADGVDILL